MFLRQMNSKIPKVINNYELEKEIYEMTCGKIFIGINKYINKKVYIKIYDKLQLYTEFNEVSLINNEIFILKLINHKNILQLYEFIESDNFIFIIYEYFKGETLQKFFSNRKKLNEKLTLKIFYDIIITMNDLHNMNICHLNLTLENILIDENYHIKIIDFQNSCLYKGKIKKIIYQKTNLFSCPEILSLQFFSPEKADVYSCGIILYYLLFQNLPFNSDKKIVIEESIIKGKYNIPNNLPNNIYNLISEMLEYNLEKRIHFNGVMSCEWFKENKNIISNSSINKCINIFTQKNPIDDNILKVLESYKIDKLEITKDISNNKFNSSTSIYKQILEYFNSKNIQNANDRISEKYKNYKNNKDNYYTEKEQKENIEKYINNEKEKNEKIREMKNNYYSNCFKVLEELKRIKIKIKEQKYNSKDNKNNNYDQYNISKQINKSFNENATKNIKYSSLKKDNGEKKNHHHKKVKIKSEFEGANSHNQSSKNLKINTSHGKKSKDNIFLSGTKRKRIYTLRIKNPKTKININTNNNLEESNKESLENLHKDYKRNFSFHIKFTEQNKNNIINKSLENKKNLINDKKEKKEGNYFNKENVDIPTRKRIYSTINKKKKINFKKESNNNSIIDSLIKIREQTNDEYFSLRTERKRKYTSITKNDENKIKIYSNSNNNIKDENNYFPKQKDIKVNITKNDEKKNWPNIQTSLLNLPEISVKKEEEEEKINENTDIEKHKENEKLKKMEGKKIYKENSLNLINGKEKNLDIVNEKNKASDKENNKVQTENSNKYENKGNNKSEKKITDFEKDNDTLENKKDEENIKINGSLDIYSIDKENNNIYNTFNKNEENSNKNELKNIQNENKENCQNILEHNSEEKEDSSNKRSYSSEKSNSNSKSSSNNISKKSYKNNNKNKKEENKDNTKNGNINKEEKVIKNIKEQNKEIMQKKSLKKNKGKVLKQIKKKENQKKEKDDDKSNNVPQKSLFDYEKSFTELLFPKKEYIEKNKNNINIGIRKGKNNNIINTNKNIDINKKSNINNNYKKKIIIDNNEKKVKFYGKDIKKEKNKTNNKNLNDIDSKYYNLIFIDNKDKLSINKNKKNLVLSSNANFNDITSSTIKASQVPSSNNSFDILDDYKSFFAYQNKIEEKEKKDLINIIGSHKRISLMNRNNRENNKKNIKVVEKKEDYNYLDLNKKLKNKIIYENRTNKVNKFKDIQKNNDKNYYEYLLDDFPKNKNVKINENKLKLNKNNTEMKNKKHDEEKYCYDNGDFVFDFKNNKIIKKTKDQEGIILKKNLKGKEEQEENEENEKNDKKEENEENEEKEENYNKKENEGNEEKEENDEKEESDEKEKNEEKGNEEKEDNDENEEKEENDEKKSNSDSNINSRNNSSNHIQLNNNNTKRKIKLKFGKYRYLKNRNIVDILSSKQNLNKSDFNSEQNNDIFEEDYNISNDNKTGNNIINNNNNEEFKSVSEFALSNEKSLNIINIKSNKSLKDNTNNQYKFKNIISTKAYEFNNNLEKDNNLQKKWENNILNLSNKGDIEKNINYNDNNNEERAKIKNSTNFLFNESFSENYKENENNDNIEYNSGKNSKKIMVNSTNHLNMNSSELLLNLMKNKQNLEIKHNKNNSMTEINPKSKTKIGFKNDNEKDSISKEKESFKTKKTKNNLKKKKEKIRNYFGPIDMGLISFKNKEESIYEIIQRMNEKDFECTIKNTIIKCKKKRKIIEIEIVKIKGNFLYYLTKKMH